MAKKAEAAARTYWILRRRDGRYCGSPVDTVTRNPNLAACWTSQAEAEATAKTLGASFTAVPFAAEDDAWRAAGKPSD